MPKMMSPATTIWFVPLAGIADPAAPKVTEINAGTNISGAIVTGFTLGATASDTDDSKTIVDEGNVTTPTLGNYEAELTFFRSDVANVTAIFNTAFALFKVPRVQGFLVSRQGKKATAAAATGDDVSLFSVISDSPKDVEGDKGSPIQFSVKFLARGFMNINFTLV